MIRRNSPVGCTPDHLPQASARSAHLLMPPFWLFHERHRHIRLLNIGCRIHLHASFNVNAAFINKIYKSKRRWHVKVRAWRRRSKPRFEVCWATLKEDFSMHPFLFAAIGGTLIGVSVVLLMFLTGRPNSANTKIAITITQSRKAVPHRGWIRLKRCTRS